MAGLHTITHIFPLIRRYFPTEIIDNVSSSMGKKFTSPTQLGMVMVFTALKAMKIINKLLCNVKISIDWANCVLKYSQVIACICPSTEEIGIFLPKVITVYRQPRVSAISPRGLQPWKKGTYISWSTDGWLNQE